MEQAIRYSPRRHGRIYRHLIARAGSDIVRFTIVTIMARIVLAEQSYAATGLLTLLGQNNDQLGPFFLIVFLASVAGVVVSAVTLNVERLAHPVMLAIAIVAAGAELATGRGSSCKPRRRAAVEWSRDILARRL